LLLVLFCWHLIATAIECNSLANNLVE